MLSTIQTRQQTGCCLEFKLENNVPPVHAAPALAADGILRPEAPSSGAGVLAGRHARLGDDPKSERATVLLPAVLRREREEGRRLHRPRARPRGGGARLEHPHADRDGKFAPWCHTHARARWVHTSGRSNGRDRRGARQWGVVPSRGSSRGFARVWSTAERSSALGLRDTQPKTSTSLETARWCCQRTGPSRTCSETPVSSSSPNLSWIARNRPPPSSLQGADRLRVDLLVPASAASMKVVAVPELHAHATALPHFSYLLEQPMQSVLLGRFAVIPVNVPLPERFAWHKLLLSQLKSRSAGQEGEGSRAGRGVVRVAGRTGARRFGGGVFGASEPGSRPHQDGGQASRPSPQGGAPRSRRGRATRLRELRLARCANAARWPAVARCTQRLTSLSVSRHPRSSETQHTR